ncbi:hypothetical protein [Fredinandcohnia sp. 179-A 10B2 NHS]|uniref:YqgU-like beta propeller domain-containing protein n=1 Tax=Fredinandcohnia sp. 179-A 10B2 NHS TaxID=3235176 RepID=UPI0039A228D2
MRIPIFFLYIVLFLVGCSSHQLLEISDVPKSSDKNVSKSPVPSEFLGENRPIQTLDMSGEAFNTVGEWYDNESILYVVDADGGSELYRYHLYSGERELFLKTDSPILTMKANEDHSLFLIHTSNFNNQATLTTVDKEGSILYEWEIQSFDLFYSWNPYQTDQVFVTTFLEDWSFQTHLLDVSTKNLMKFEVFQPFVQWMDANTISYLKWNQNELDYFAPLHSYHLDTKTEGLLFENIISFATYNQLLVTYELDHEKDAYGKINFFHPEMNKKLYEASVPLLSDYSKWYIPASDYAPLQKVFYSFRPYSTGAFDTYSEKFELVAYNLSTGKEEVVLEEVDDSPLNFSPDGYLALYGYKSENLIDIKTKTVIELVNY